MLKNNLRFVLFFAAQGVQVKVALQAGLSWGKYRKWSNGRQQQAQTRKRRLRRSPRYSSSGTIRPPRTVAPITMPALTRTMFLIIYCPSSVGA